MNDYASKNRHKYYLKAHLIFVCTYRKQLLTGETDSMLKSCFSEISTGSKFDIEIMESDNDHIHLSITSIVRKLKQISTHRLWNKFPSLLRKCFWKEHTFWSDGCFVCSIGEANPETIRKYIENQG
ncbi:MAG: IS200/IS605 family transposase [Erysipelotrichaceae bacterium]|nr:IS200/IS605 family transposase [Erysipelotrichaceae bacterium]